MTLTLDNLAQLIYDREHGMDIAGLEVKYGVSKKAVWKIIGRKEEIRSALRQGVSVDKKRMGQALDFPQIDAYVLRFIRKARERNFPVTPITVLDAASVASDKLKLTDFKASTGWLRQFRLRHNLDFKTLHGNFIMTRYIILYYIILNYITLHYYYYHYSYYYYHYNFLYYN